MVYGEPASTRTAPSPQEALPDTRATVGHMVTALPPDGVYVNVTVPEGVPEPGEFAETAAL
jgi:hypothetical protein